MGCSQFTAGDVYTFYRLSKSLQSCINLSFSSFYLDLNCISEQSSRNLIFKNTGNEIVAVLGLKSDV